ncbi:MAG: mandelate racemase/muconate lactonizing enzyme family protein [Chloroflexi bacterium]|nr:mandelate racemase/muconate lactonizing enzyme family protein [Chloroflexota bacterium]
MKITRIETIRASAHPRLLWVQVHTDTRLVGLGETYYVPGAVAAVIHDVAAPLLLGEDPLDIERHWATFFAVTNYYGYAGAEMRALSALDIALWDIKGQACGQPIYGLLGGRVRERIRVYNTCASYGPVHGWAAAAGIPASARGHDAAAAGTAGGHRDYRDYEASHERPGELARDLLAMGISAMKIWPFDRFARASGGQYISPEELNAGLAVVQQIREAVGDRMEIAIELHAKWNLPSAIRIAHALEPYHILWFEDAMTPDPVDDLARLVQETRVPICVSERLFTRYAFRQVLERRAAHIVMPDIIWTGGISEGKKIAAMAEAYHLPIAPHDCTGPVNVFACAHLCASCPNAMIMETVRAFYLGYYEEVVTPSIDVRDGHLHFPDAPGLGIRLRPAFLARPDVHVQSTT